MHVAVIGMGALGRVYGARLSLRSNASVTFVLKPGRASAPLSLTRIDGDHASDKLVKPTTDAQVPRQADVALVCVRAEQLDARLDDLLMAGPGVPVIVFTALLPSDFDRLVRVHGSRILAAMPGVVAHIDGDRCRYWLPKVAPTLIDEVKPVAAVVAELVCELNRAGMPARIEPGVRETTLATTVSFVPLAMGIDAAGGVDALLGDRSLVRVALDAVDEGLILASQLGTAPAWVGALARFAGPTTLKIGVGLVRRRTPEVIRYVDEHFGRKLHAQSVVMANAIVDLARQKGTPSAALEILRGRLVSR